MSTETVLAPGGGGEPLGIFIKRHLREYGMLLSLIAIMIFFQFMTNGTLLKPLNLTNLILQNSYIIIMALGMLLVIVAGHIDLSVGSVVGFIGALAAVMMVQFKIHYIPTTIICLAVGGLIGAAQGYWVAFFKIPSFIVTLAGMLVFKGLSLALLAGQSVGPFPPEFQKLLRLHPGHLRRHDDGWLDGPCHLRPARHRGAADPDRHELPQPPEPPEAWGGAGTAALLRGEERGHRPGRHVSGLPAGDPIKGCPTS